MKQIKKSYRQGMQSIHQDNTEHIPDNSDWNAHTCTHFFNPVMIVYIIVAPYSAESVEIK